jgi:nicotinamidase-related amidase
MQHPSRIPEKIVNKVVARRGRLHAFETIDPNTTALVVIDLDEATVAGDETAQRMVANVNAIARAVRQSGGIVAWVLSRMNAMPKHFSAILGTEVARRYVNDGQAGGPGTRLWHTLEREPTDIVAVKSGASAFFPGKCDLQPQLDARGVDTILIRRGDEHLL